MTSRPALVMLGLCTTVLVLAALYAARSILAPVAFSLFVIAIVALIWIEAAVGIFH